MTQKRMVNIVLKEEQRNENFLHEVHIAAHQLGQIL